MSERATIADLERRLAVAEAALREKSHVEADLRQSKELCRIAIEGARMGTWRWNLRDEHIRGDAAFLDLWGFPPSDEPRRLLDFLGRMSAQGRTEMGEMVTRAVAAGEEFDGQLAIVNGPTEGRWVRWRGRAEREQPWLVNGVSFDVTAQRLGEERLRASEERYRAFVTASSDAVYRMSPDWLQMRQLDGRGFLVDTGGPDEDWIETYILCEDRPHVLAAIDASIRDKRTFELEHRVRRADGSVGWTLSRAVPIFAADGAITEWLGAARDVTERKVAETALRESEERFAQFAVSSSDALWIRDAATFEMEYTSPAIQGIYGIAPGALLGDIERWLSLILPDDRATAHGHLTQARDGAAVVHEFRILRPIDGELRWIRNTDFPLRDVQGRVQRIGGIAEDVTEAKNLRAHQTVLVAELQHRTRNLMGVVRSMVEKTLARSADLTDFRARIGDRLAALARVQGLLSRLDEWDRVTFDELIRSELSALNGEAERVTLDGPDGVALRSSTVQTFALALHELMTNALKYGALAQPDGRIAVVWRVERAESDGRRWLHVDWRESGVAMPMVGEQPQGGGSGRELIERALPYQLGAKTTYVMEGDGVNCSIAMPVSERQAVGEKADA